MGNARLRPVEHAGRGAVEKQKDIGLPSAAKRRAARPERDHDRRRGPVRHADRRTRRVLAADRDRSVVLIGATRASKITLVLQMLRQVSELAERRCTFGRGIHPPRFKMRAQRLVSRRRNLLCSLAETSLDESCARPTSSSPGHRCRFCPDGLHVGAALAPGSVGQVPSFGKMMLMPRDGIPPSSSPRDQGRRHCRPPRARTYVDTVLYFEATGAMHSHLAGVKNRFGSTNEIGVFEMKESGLGRGANPRNSFSRAAEGRHGLRGRLVLEGTRPILAELQRS